MSALEDRIRAGLDADRAAPDLWEAVNKGARRRRARRTATAAVAVATVVVGILGWIGSSSVLDTRDSQAPPAHQPSDSQPLNPRDWDLPAAQFLDGETPTVSDLVGLWRVRTSDDAWLMLLGEDGYWTTTNGWDLFGGGDSGNRGTWSLADGRITQNGREGFLGNSFREVLDTALMPDGSLHQVTRPAEGRCEGATCSDEPQRFLFDRVAPGNSPLLDILSSASGISIDTEVADTYLRGVWVTTDGHWVVTVNDEGGLRAFRDSGDPSARPDDTGHVEIDDQGRLTIACGRRFISADVILTLTDPVPGLAPSGVRMQLHSIDGICGSGLGGSLQWIRVTDPG